MGRGGRRCVGGACQLAAVRTSLQICLCPSSWGGPLKPPALLPAGCPSSGGAAAGAGAATQDDDGPDVEALSEALAHLFAQHQRLVDLVTDRVRLGGGGGVAPWLAF